MKLLLLVLGLLGSPVLAAPQQAHADDKAMCLEATEQGQKLRAAHRLVEARPQFLACARPQCPSIIQQECGAWLAELDKSLPTAVITAKDGGGGDLLDVTVTVDGQPLVTKLDGDAVPVNPGRHVFHFALPDGTQLDKATVIKEGEKNQGIAVVLGKGKRHPTAPPVGTAPATTSELLAAESPPEPPHTVAPVKIAGFVVGGVGVVGLAVGAVFGALAIGDNNNAHCNAQKQCLAGPLSAANSAATASDVGLIAGGVLVATGGALVLFGPKPAAPKTAGSLRLSPVVLPGRVGLALGGTF